jgi:NAD(P)-dependent dehydrogenase (short-subunit alcohol dehydrogenase family)
MHRIRTPLKVAAICGAAYACHRLLKARARRFDFAGRTVVITGGARGLGLVMARQLAAEGALIAICSRHEDEIRRAVSELRGFGVPVLGESCDVTDSAQLDAFLARARRELGSIEALINNAGVIQVGPLDEMTASDFHEAMNIHFYAPLHAMQAVIPEMRRRGRGRVINIASIGGQISVPHLLPYCASKFALVGLSQGYRAELVKDGVYVTTVCPGLMRTGSHRRAWFKGQHRLEHAWFSWSASAPFIAMNADRAAARILSAARQGRAHITLSIPAKFAAAMNTLAPDLTADVASVAARLLPRPGGIGARSVEGRHSQSAWSPSFATLLGERAALHNNEIGSNG